MWINASMPRQMTLFPGGGSEFLAKYPPNLAIFKIYFESVLGVFFLSGLRWSRILISSAVSTAFGEIDWLSRPIIVIQKILQAKILEIEINRQSPSAVRSFDSSILQPDLRILKNTSIFHRRAYHSSFSIAAAREFTGKLVINFQSIGSLSSLVFPTSRAVITFTSVSGYILLLGPNEGFIVSFSNLISSSTVISSPSLSRKLIVHRRTYPSWQLAPDFKVNWSIGPGSWE